MAGEDEDGGPTDGAPYQRSVTSVSSCPICDLLHARLQIAGYCHFALLPMMVVCGCASVVR